ncbi:hypothetical protein [Halovenus marina]|uniref:hypothetical protein n=1 Tax=Halovenus marina TaxID=3396621 RepID=UPI003F55EAC6
MSFSELPRGAKITLGGALALIVGAFLPWASIDSRLRSATVSGVDGDGVLTLLAGVAVVAIVVLGAWRKREILASAVAGGLSVLVAFNIYTNISSYGGLSGSVSVEMGLYLTILGAALLVAGSVDTYRSRDGFAPTPATRRRMNVPHSDPTDSRGASAPQAQSAGHAQHTHQGQREHAGVSQRGHTGQPNHDGGQPRQQAGKTGRRT